MPEDRTRHQAVSTRSFYLFRDYGKLNHSQKEAEGPPNEGVGVVVVGGVGGYRDSQCAFAAALHGRSAST